MKHSDEVIIEGVRESIAEALKLPLEQVRLDSVLTEELDAVSIDFVDIMFRLESRFGVTFHPGNPLDRLAESFPGRPLSHDGALSDLGAEVIRRRMPEVDGSKVHSGMLLGNVQSLYTTATWVRAVRELLDARPARCPACGSPRLEVLRPSVLRCEGCGGEVACPTQADVLSEWARRTFPPGGKEQAPPGP
jgi:acyl carrier protein